MSDGCPPSVSSLVDSALSLRSLSLLLQLCSLLPFLPIFSLFKILIYFTVPGFSCSMWDLCSLLQHAESLVVAHRNEFTVQRLNSGPPHWKLLVLGTGPPGNAPPASLPLSFLLPVPISSFTSYSKSLLPSSCMIWFRDDYLVKMMNGC